MKTYRDLIKKLFGKQLSWQEIKELDTSLQGKIAVELKRLVTINNSPYSIEKIARAIQISRSGVGGSALTDFTCAFCNRTETWSSTAVPNICSKCAYSMAEKIVLCELDIEKEN